MKSKRKIGLLVIFLLFLLIIPLTVWSVKNLKFETRKKASEPILVEEKEFSEIRQLNISQPIYEFTASGKLTLKKENSFFRIILVDKDQKEYLVYEAYPLIVDRLSFSFTDACEETCVLEAITPDKLRIEGLATDFEITQTSYEDKFQKLPSKIQSLGIERSQAELKKEKENLKIQKLSEQIKKKGLKWIAGETSVSGLSYEEKKKLFSKPDGTPVDKLPNLQGFEYYKGGIFEIKSDNKNPSSVKGATSSNLPESWDWRNVHGENWNTQVKQQGGAGTCWAHSQIGAYEAQINLYFNQHLDLDLSEQMYVDCRDYPNRPIGLSWGAYYNECGCSLSGGVILFSDYCILSIHGVPDENCDPYVARDYPQGPLLEWYCTNEYICNNWQNRVWKNSSFNRMLHGSPTDEKANCPNTSLSYSDYDFKKAIIQKGPMHSGYAPWAHAMVLEGYEIDPLDNETVWIFKNSWGALYGEAGYVKFKTDISKIHEGYIALGPFTPPTDHSYWPAGFDGTIKCVDEDNDTYCNWGISENKPETCPAFCQPEKDCDDSSPDLGPFDENLNCMPFCVSEYFETCWAPGLTEKTCCIADAPNASCEQTAQLESSCVVLCSKDTNCPTSYPKCLIPGGYCICPDKNLGNLNCDAKSIINETDLTLLLSKWGEANLPSLETLLSHWKTQPGL